VVFIYGEPPVPGSIEITKVFTDQTSPGGITFDLYQNENKIATQTTNSSGIALFSNLQPGQYTLEEVNIPLGYTNNLTTINPISVTAGQTTKVTVTNSPEGEDEPTTGTVIVTKTFIDELSPEGITFELRLGEVVLTQTTNNEGVATFLDVEPGSYELFETNIPQGYINNLSENNTVVVTAGNITYVTVTNSPEGEEEPPGEEPPVE
jgi:uncharacterized surface anchored protein